MGDTCAFPDDGGPQNPLVHMLGRDDWNWNACKIIHWLVHENVSSDAKPFGFKIANLPIFWQKTDFPWQRDKEWYF